MRIHYLLIFLLLFGCSSAKCWDMKDVWEFQSDLKIEEAKLCIDKDSKQMIAKVNAKASTGDKMGNSLLGAAGAGGDVEAFFCGEARGFRRTGPTSVQDLTGDDYPPVMQNQMSDYLKGMESEECTAVAKYRLNGELVCN